MTPKKLNRILRRVVLICALSGVGYLYVRFDGLHLPAEQDSPLLRFSPGAHLVLDRYPEAYLPSDAAVFLGPDGRTHLALVMKVREQQGKRQYWLGHDVPDCPVPDSEELGWVAEEWLAARVILVWPW